MWRTPWDTNSCSTVPLNVAPCAAEVRTGTVAAMTIARQIDGATKQGAPTYIGHVPPAISGLWRSTKAMVDAASKDGHAYQVQCSGKTSNQCAGLAQTFTNDMDALQLDFAGWQPYM